MLRIFESATLKLTGWYLLILMVITSLFSVVIYQLATQELNGRLERLELRLEDDPKWVLGRPVFKNARLYQEHEANARIFVGLLYTNFVIWLIGGAGSYWLARLTLRPIQDMHEAQGRFTSDASHELKTPLAVMKSELELALRDQSLKKADYKQVVASSLEEVNKLTDLTQSLLQMSRLDHAKIQLDDTVDLHAEVSHVAHLLDKDTRIKIDAPKNLPTVQGNASMLRDVCMVVLDNALRYSPKDSTVTVRLQTASKAIRIKVTNAGNGIMPDDLDHVFDAFYRADTSRTSGHTTKSYGLGLSVAKKIVSLHDGTISISSRPDGDTNVVILLPLSR
ncbi:hypothetical protein KBD87_02555 [Candidatus Saccharibacteria bacterium]|nr:hypothetical protein [Candidatus Saccharibacteria bacterium]